MTVLNTLERGAPLRLLVFVPHRDARLPLRKWSAALFADGCNGAWSFPWIAPLALLDKPFDDDELKSLALALREQSLANGQGGKFTAGQTARAVFPNGVLGGAALFGMTLHVSLPDSFFSPASAAKIISRFSPLVLGAALLRAGEAAPVLPPPALSFRAAALANMICRPFPQAKGDGAAYSLEWKIGALRWLAKPLDR